MHTRRWTTGVFSLFLSFLLLHFPSATLLPTMLPFPFSRISSSHMPIMTRTEVIVFCFTDREAGRIWIGALSLGRSFKAVFRFLSLFHLCVWFSDLYNRYPVIIHVPASQKKERKG